MFLTVSRTTILLMLTLVLVACQGNRPRKPGNAASDDVINQPLTMTFDAEKQNQIFRTILEKTQSESCQESRPKASGRLITANEYVQSIELVFELDLEDQIVKQALPTESVALLGYDHFRQFNVISAERLSSYLTANGLVAKQIKEKKASILNCGREASACVQDWLTARLPMLWRQKIDATRIQVELALFSSLGGDLDAFAVLVERLLLSPHFLFRQQLGLDGSLNSWELASLMADVLWDLPPSTELAQLAEQNNLNSAAALRQQIQSMTQDNRFLGGLKRFSNYWLATGILDRKNFAGAGNTAITDAIKSGMKDESAAFLYYLVRSQQDQFSNIFGADFTVGNAAYASTFALTMTDEKVPGLPDGYAKLRFPAERAGLVSAPSVVAISSNLATTNIPLRGKNVMEKFFCQTLSTPPNLATVVASVKFDTSVSVHEALDKVTNVGGCADCHKLVNGIGFGMENVGPDGRMQANDNHGFPVMEPAGSFFAAATGINAAPSAFTGVAGLGKALSTNKEVEACLAVQAFRLVYARLEEPDDVCTIVNVYKRASQNNFELDQLLTEMIIKRSRLAE